MVKKCIASLAVMLAIITGFFTIDGHYAKSQDLDDHKQMTAQSLTTVVTEFQLSLERQALNDLTTQINSQKRWIRKFPDDVEAQHDLQEMRERRVKTEDRIKKLECD